MEEKDESCPGESISSCIPESCHEQANDDCCSAEVEDLPVLGYWKMRGLAQPIRFLLAYLNVRYHEYVYEQGEAPDFSSKAWTDVKDTLELDFPSMPYFIDHEVRLTEPLAIIKYIASHFGPESVSGATLEERAEVEMLSHILLDLTK